MSGAGVADDLGAAMAAQLPYLSLDPGDCAIAGVSVDDLLERFGTPLIVYVPQRIEDNLASVVRAFGRRFPDVAVHYALKACYFPMCLEAARRAGAGIEVMSGLELQMAEQAGFAGEQLAFNGLGRDPAYVRRTGDHPRALNVLDTWADYESLCAEAERRGRVVDVAIRVVPPVPVMPATMPLDSKLGATWDSEAFWQLYNAVARHPFLALRGLHTHLFTHGASVEDYRTYVRSVAAVARSLLERTGKRFDTIDLGGGFETRARMEAHGVTIDDFAAAAAEELASVPYGFRLAVEPGRYAVADAAVGITTVVAQQRRDDFTWQLVDLATNTLIPIMDYPAVGLPPATARTGGPVAAEAPATPRSRIGDGTCAPSIICDSAALGDCQVGSQLALLDVGGYTTVFAHIWGPRPPAIVAVDSDADVSSLVSRTAQEQVARILYGYEVELS